MERLGGEWMFAGSAMRVHRMGYAAMQLAGPQVWGPPRDIDGAIAVLRDAVDAGVNHIDTSDFYGLTSPTKSFGKHYAHTRRSWLL